MTLRSRLLRLVYSPPERRWWGGTLIVPVGVYLAVWYGRTQGRLYGALIALAAVCVEALLFHVLVRRRRSSHKDVAA